MAKAKNIGQLRESGFSPESVKEEMRRNLIRKIEKKQEILPGIIGFQDSVIPQLENAVLSGQDVIFLGERGQAKSRIIRSLIGLLDETIPVIASCEINDHPFQPICKSCRDRVKEEGDNVEIAWQPREERYGEKLATPDSTIADLIGEVDPIKVAEGRYLSDELTIHYGLIPRTNRGIFCINELPDLAERIQVGLLNIMEERDVQIRGYRIRLPLDVLLVASANPEDYTNRGRIITPLRDRYGAQIRTHYPRRADDELDIVEQEYTRFEDEDRNVTVPQYMKEIVVEITRLARRSPDVNQRSGVSVRASIADYESMLANALRRSIRAGDKDVVPRISDLPFILPTISGKVEFDTVEDDKEEQIIEKLIQSALLAVFNRNFNVIDLEEIVTQFKSGISVEVSDAMPSKQYVKIVKQVEGMDRAVAKLEPGENIAVIAAAVEFVLEGLHLNKRLNKDKVGGRTQYRG